MNKSEQAKHDEEFQKWWCDPKRMGSTFGYQGTFEGVHEAIRSQAQLAWNAAIAQLCAKPDAMSALAEYHKCMEEEDEAPIALERLRFYCSLAMPNGTDWIDSEPFFDDIENELDAAQAKPDSAEQVPESLEELRTKWKIVDGDCRDTVEGLITFHVDAFDEGYAAAPLNIAQQAPEPMAYLVECLTQDIAATCWMHPFSQDDETKWKNTPLYIAPPNIAALQSQLSQAQEENARLKEGKLNHCAAARDGDCSHKQCPQLRDGEPVKTGRHCPLDNREAE